MEPAAETDRQLIGTDPITGQEVLVTLFTDGTGEVAYRDPISHRWGMPTYMAPHE